VVCVVLGDHDPFDRHGRPPGRAAVRGPPGAGLCRPPI